MFCSIRLDIIKKESPINVLVIGTGAREHAIIWKFSTSPLIGKLYAAPENLDFTEDEYCVITIHLYENTENPLVLKAILTLINALSKKIQLVCPLHPETRKKIQKLGLGNLVQLMVKSRGIITGSGGIQEETSYLCIPYCTLRDNTERPITIDMGLNKLFSIYTAKTDEIMHHLSCSNLKRQHIPLWDNKVSVRMIKTLSQAYIRGH